MLRRSMTISRASLSFTRLDLKISKALSAESLPQVRPKRKALRETGALFCMLIVKRKCLYGVLIRTVNPHTDSHFYES